MTVLVIGGSGSGKSEYAENLILELGERRRIYLAAMKPWDSECERRIERHRQMRAKKNFETLERYRDLKNLALPVSKARTAVLLECVSNLLSNEMFGLGEKREILFSDEEQAAKEVLEGIFSLQSQAGDLVVVTNEVFSDGADYEGPMKAYLAALGEINRRTAEAANVVMEVVAGIPVAVKGGSKGSGIQQYVHTNFG